MEKNKKKRGLGRGLDALFSDSEIISESEVKNISVKKIIPNPSQPRRKFNEEKLASLSETIKKEGIISPILVTPRNGQFLIIAGERRYRAAKLAGLNEIPCIVKMIHEDEILILSLIENIQREDLNPIEEANAIQSILRETGYTHEKASKILGKSRVYITNMLRLLTLSNVVQDLILNERISGGHGRCLVGLSEKDALKYAKLVIEKGLSVRELENLFKNKNKKQKNKLTKEKKDMFIREIEEGLSDAFSRAVTIKNTKNYTGEVKIRFYNLDDLNKLLELLGYKSDI